ncbi:MAG: glycosyltransferase [Desulfuromonadaceae bacterium]|nr:glycosyltransferase [Desulfuromonadaceae bacterium]MDD2856858.1 glycosyltransferase [Desulfuromonadaceae bacterium]
MKSVSVIIPNYNGVELLKQYLPPLQKSLSECERPSEIIVVDDASSDDSVDYLKQNHPEIRVFINPENKGFGGTMNHGILEAVGDIVFSLNSDVLVDTDIFSLIIPRFSDPDLFAVTPNIIDPRTGYNQAVYRLRPENCWYTDICLQHADPSKEIPLFFACGGACFYDRKKLIQLGCFETIYSPFYIEDVDLSYQAWKRGWKCILAPEARVFHFSNSTIEKHHRKRKIKFLTARNKNYFLWMNITDSKLVWRYWFYIIPSLLFDIINFRKYKFVGTFMALPKLKEVIRKRHERKVHSKISDAEIIGLLSFKK